MKKNLRYLAGAAVGAVAAIGFTSCAYDPYYSSVGVGGSYSSGYGDGYGYGGSGFSTSVFVGTGDPNWGYDPACYSYYHYGSRRYYDPYSYGYYPIGYRPRVVYGVPHPYGWRPGGGYIRPPIRVSDRILSNYDDRESRYRSSSYGWAKQVRQAPATPRNRDSKEQRSSNQRSSTSDYSRSREESRSSGSSSRESQSRSPGSQSTRESSRSSVRSQSGGLPDRYNTPVTSSQKQARSGQRATQATRNERPPSKDYKADRSQKQKQSNEDKKRERQYR